MLQERRVNRSPLTSTALELLFGLLFSYVSFRFILAFYGAKP